MRTHKTENICMTKDTIIWKKASVYRKGNTFIYYVSGRWILSKIHNELKKITRKQITHLKFCTYLGNSKKRKPKCIRNIQRNF